MLRGVYPERSRRAWNDKRKRFGITKKAGDENFKESEKSAMSVFVRLAIEKYHPEAKQ